MRTTSDLMYSEETTLPTPAGFADVSVQLTHVLSTRPAYITFGLDPSSSDPQAVALGVSTAWAAAGSMGATMDNNCTMTQVRVSLGTDGGEDLVGLVTSSVTGSLTQTGPPANVAVLIHKTTSRGGRRGRGRLYLPWCLSSSEFGESGIITTGRVTSLQNASDTFLNALNTGPGPMVILHNPGKTLPGAPNQVTKLNVDKLVGTQRRRLGR